MPNGEQYWPWNARPPMDATVDLNYSQPLKPGAVGYVVAPYRPPVPLWSPWAVDSGRYWQLYNSNAPATANLFGIFAGRTSDIVGGVAGGAGIFHGPGDAAGVTAESNRMAPDLSVTTPNAYSWGMYFGTKADLLPETDIQPIGLQQNRHGGLALKVAGYKQDFIDPTGGYGKLYMGQAAITALKTRVANDLEEYQRLYEVDSTVRPILDLWRFGDAASLQAVVAEVLTVADALTSALTVGDGIYDRQYHYFEGGQPIIRAILFLDQALAHPLLTAVNRLELKKAAHLFASVLWDEDFVPFSGNAYVGLGLSNNISQYQSYRDAYALYLGSDPAWVVRADEVVNRTVTAFNITTNEQGSANASTGYLAANLWPIFNVFLQVRELRGQDLFASSPRIPLLGEFLIAMMSPPEARFGGTRKLLAVGNGSTEGSPLPGVLATGLRPSNPALAARLQHAWGEMGSPHHFFFGSSLLMIDEAASQTPTVRGNATFPGYFSVQRGVEEGLESAVWVIDGHYYSDHRTPDQGTLTLYGYGQPLSLSWGSLYYPPITGALWRSCVQPAHQIDGWWGAADLPIEQGNVWWNSTAVPGEFESDGQLWKRTVKLATVGARKVLAVRDHSALPFVWSLNLMAKDLVTPPTGSSFVPPAHPLAPLTGTLPAGTYRWKCKGQWGVDFDLWVVAANPIDWAWSSWSHGWHPPLEQQQYLAATGLPFEESQYTIRLRTMGQLEWAVIPYPVATPWPGTVQDTPTGLGFTGGITLVDLP